MATHQNANLRDPPRAIKLAKRACELTEHKKPELLDTLAAAYASAGQFEYAMQTAQKALDLALAAENQPLAEHIRSRLQEYRQKPPDRICVVSFSG